MATTPPNRNHYGEWQIYFAERMAELIAASQRDYIANFDISDIIIGRFRLALRWPAIYIIHSRHEIEEANVSGGKLHGKFVYDIVVEDSGDELDESEKNAILVIGDIIALLHTDPHLIDTSGQWTCRGMDLEMLEPVYPLDPNTNDLYVQIGLRVTIYKSLELSA